jgi:hypothetical protein
MSITKSFHESHSLHAASDRLAGFGSALHLYWDAMREGLAAAGKYQELTARGVPHDVAVRRVFNEHFGA